MSEPKMHRVIVTLCEDCLLGKGDYHTTGAPDEGTKSADVEYCGTSGCANENLAMPNHPLPHEKIDAGPLVEITVNGYRVAVPGPTITHNEVACIAGLDDNHPGVLTVTYCDGRARVGDVGSAHQSGPRRQHAEGGDAMKVMFRGLEREIVYWDCDDDATVVCQECIRIAMEATS